jgi:hypothetical protein
VSGKRPAVLEDRQLELGVGVVLFLAGAWMIRDAYEGRGRKRPFPASLILP